MENLLNRAHNPGHYRFRPSRKWPWITVRVFRESAANQNKLCVRMAGVVLAADRLKGQWQAV